MEVQEVEQQVQEVLAQGAGSLLLRGPGAPCRGTLFSTQKRPMIHLPRPGGSTCALLSQRASEGGALQ